MPVPTALHASHAANMAAAKAKKAHQHHHYRRAALAPLSKPANDSVAVKSYPFGIINDQMMIAAGGHHGRPSRARVMMEDENTPFDAQYAYGAPPISKQRPFAQGVTGHQPGGPMSSLHVLPDVSRHNQHYRRQHQHRHSLSSWPPSPNGFPPTPTFEDDVHHALGGEAASHEPVAAWPAAPSFGETSLISGGGSYSTSVAPETDADATLVGENCSPLSEDAHAKLVPSPTELLRIANEQARANAATNLSDWVSEVIWEMCVPMMSGYDGSSPPSSISLRRSQSLSANHLVPPPFKRFAQQTIYQVSASAGSLFLGIWYIRRLPIGPAHTADGDKIFFNEKERAFRDDLLAMRSEIPWRLLVLGLTLSNKWLEDNTFTTKTWNEVTGLSIQSMKSVENRALALFEWIFSPRLEEWMEFLQQLRNREVANHAAALPNAIGSERRSSMSMSFSHSDSSNGKRPIRVIDDLMAEVRATAMMFDPVFPGVSPTSSPSGNSTLASPASPATSLSESFATTSSAQSQPRPLSPPQLESNWRSRPASWSELPGLPLGERQQLPRASSDELVSRFSIRPRRIKTPAAWDPAASALDSPLLRDDIVCRKARPTYEAVQRPPPLLLIPPPPRFDDYSTESFVPRAKYEEASEGMLEDPDTTYVSSTSFSHYESSGEADRAWYDAKLPRTIMSETHGNSWTASFAGMISSF